MTTVFIKDTGYVTPGVESGTAESGVNIVNGGTEIPLKITRIDYTRGANVDNKPQPATYTDTTINFVSFDNPTITIQGTLDLKGDLSNASNVIYRISSVTSFTDRTAESISREFELLELLDRLCVTKGYKELYYKDSETEPNLLNALGKTDAYNLTYRHLHVRCTNITITQTPNRSVAWRLVCEVEKAP